MSDFRTEELNRMSGRATEESTEQQTEETQQEQSQEQATQETSQSEQQTTEQQEQTTREPKKVELDLFDFLKQHEDTVLKVLTEKGKDYSSLDNEQALRLKLQKENPEWDKDDVESELQDKYAVGLTKLEINESEMTDEEIKEAKAHNKRIDTALRSLKKDGKQAIEYLSNLNADVELPKFEYTYEEDSQGSPVNPEEILAQYQQQFIEQTQKQKEEQWIPELKTAFASLDSIKEEVKYVDNGNEVVLNVDYKLSEAEKNEVLKDLSDYVGQTKDDQYLIKDAEGNITGTDVQRFVRDKSEELLRHKIYKTIAKEAAANARKEFVKKNVVNYSEEARNTVNNDGEDNSFENFMLNKKK